MMLVSVVISTRNRASQLQPCLVALANLEADFPCEIVIVDNGSTDETAAVVQRFAVLSKIPVTYVHEPVKGLSSARNAGVAASRGALIAFTDDDCYVAPDYLQQMAGVFSDQDLGYCTGRIMLHDASDYPSTINESTIAFDIPPHSYIPPGMVKGANMVFRKAALQSLGEFDTLFGSGSLFAAEDCDAAARASQAGWRGAYRPSIVVSHHHGRKANEIGKLLKAYDIGRGAYHMKLLSQGQTLSAGVKGWLGLPRRVLDRPASIYWEGAGALHYLAIKLGLTSRPDAG